MSWRVVRWGAETKISWRSRARVNHGSSRWRKGVDSSDGVENWNALDLDLLGWLEGSLDHWIRSLAIGGYAQSGQIPDGHNLRLKAGRNDTPNQGFGRIIDPSEKSGWELSSQPINSTARRKAPGRGGLAVVAQSRSGNRARNHSAENRPIQRRNLGGAWLRVAPSQPPIRRLIKRNKM